MVSSSYLPGILLWPLAGAVVTALGRHRFSQRSLAAIGSGTVGLAFLHGVAAWLQLRSLDPGQVLVFPLWRWAAGGELAVTLGLWGDPLALWWALIVTGVGFLIHLYSAGYMAGDPSFGRYYAQLNYFVFAMSLLVLSDGLVGLILGWGNVGLASYLLIGFWHRRDAARRAATKAFLITQAGEVAMLLGLFWAAAAFGELHYPALFARLEGVPQGTLTAISLLLLVGAVAKSAQLPLHTWLPDAMQGPTPVSALIHAATMVTAGVFLVCRMWPLFSASGVALQVVAWVGGLTALFGAVVAGAQWDIKRVLAYSTMSQVGYMLLGAGVGAFAASAFHFFTHAFFKALLFLAAGVVIHRLDGEQDLRRMGGLRRSMPFTFASFLVGLGALAGLPPLAGFFSKDEILAATRQAGEPLLWALGVAAAALTAYYSFRLLALAFLGPEGPAVQATSSRRAGGEGPWTMLLPVGLLLVGAVAAGWLAIPGVTAVPAQVLEGTFRGQAFHPEGDSLTLTASLLAALVGMGVALARFRPSRPVPQVGPPGLAEAGFELDRLFRHLTVEPGLALARVVAWVDRRGVDGLVNGLAWLTGQAGERVRRLHRGQVRRSVVTLLGGAALLLVGSLWLLSSF
ncbi:NADH-quinone oxidoreductase subunit L [Limnochorda sp.]|uniref:NADH-quinone oxidoreductase subunit L n=1 Tax=Limnochorda sp. TaxID=1940279 RepID=UPI00180759A1|nr:NADH-quinone oxidoreductase subunit L [Bacillota bacterium]MBO2519259.1 NADH-quinone oxidoreductase subunit L [Bacillota bacterium]NMA70535.1 NADH-quinone oxidoreductase subunit L [Bacillota bacterium]